MIKRHGPVSFASPAPRGGGAVFATRIGLAILSLATFVTYGPSTAVFARESLRNRSSTAAGSMAAAMGSCALTRFASGRVKTVIDGRTFVFEDGREVRLAAIEVAPIAARSRGEPQLMQPDPINTRHDDGAGEAARRALAALTAGREVVLKHADPKAPPADRYGRLIAFGFVTNGTTERSLQDALLASGHAQLSARIEPPACLPGLRAHEDAARRASLGLWADPLYSVRNAERPADILPQRGRFAVVEGEVMSVRESGGTIYVNFSRRWSKGFSAFIRKRNAARFPAAGLDLKRLEGRRVEVRGFVEQRRGPLMAVERPEQIAIVDGQAPARP
jgi:endonuclease YncB( thermonuclease family)